MCENKKKAKEDASENQVLQRENLRFAKKVSEIVEQKTSELK